VLRNFHALEPTKDELEIKLLHIHRIPLGAHMYQQTDRYRNIYSPILLVNVIKYFSLIFISLLLLGCGSSSEDGDKYGYIKIYNASNNAPEIRINMTYDDTETYGYLEYGESTSTKSIISNKYTMELAWQEDADDYSLVEEREIKITNDDVKLVVIAGDFYNSEILTFDFEYEDTTLYDETDEDNFSLRIINTKMESGGIDIYLSKNDETFNESVFVSTVYYGEISENNYYEVDTYKVYFTETGSSDVIFESGDISFVQNEGYIVSARSDSGPSDSPFSIDVLGQQSSANISDVNSGSELRIYNGIIQHELLPEFFNEVNITIDGADDIETIQSLAKGTMSNTLSLPASDYSLDIKPVESDTLIAENHFISLNANDDVTTFMYLTEVTQVIDDEPDTTEVYVNTLPVSNSNRISLYDHQIKVINLVQDDEFNNINIYFVRSNETVSSADYSLYTTMAVPKSITLPNNTYDVSLIVTVNESTLLLATVSMTFTSNDGDYFLVIEKDESTSSGYSAQFIPQSN